MRTKKVFYNVIATALYRLTVLVCGLILPRLILGAFGSAYNGIVLSVTQFLDYISILTLGIAGATRVAIYKANAENDNYKLSAILKAHEQYMRKIAYAFLCYMALLAVFYPLIIGSEYRWLDVASLVVIIGIGIFAQYFFGITYSTLLSATQNEYIYTALLIGEKVASTVVSFILIKKGYSIQLVKLGSGICFALVPILLNVIAKRKFQLIKNVQPDKTLLKQRNDVMIHSVANIIYENTDVFLVTIVSGPVKVSIYSVYKLVLGNLSLLQRIFTSGLEAAFGDIWAHGEKDKFAEKLAITEFFVYAFTLIMFSCAAVLILPFIRLYTDDVADVNYILPGFAALYVMASAAQCLRAPYAVGVQAAGKYKETKNIAVQEAAINLLISAVGVFFWDLSGVMIGTLFAGLYRTFRYAGYVYRDMLEKSTVVVVKRMLWLVGSGAVIIALQLYGIENVIVISNWTTWIAAGMLCGIIALVVTGISSALFYRREFFSIIGVVQKMVRKQ